MLAARLPGAPAGGSRRAAALIERLGVAAVAGHRPHELSGGEQQRFAVARALVNDPRAGAGRRGDREPRLGLRARRCWRPLARARGGGPRAVVLVTHEPQSAAAADRVLHLVDGRSGAPEIMGIRP